MPETWDTSLAIKYDTNTNEISFTPITKLDDVGITIAKGVEAEKIMSAFEKRNAELLTGDWKKGWNAFCLSEKDKYMQVIKRACNSEYIEKIASDPTTYAEHTKKIDAPDIGSEITPIDLFNTHFAHYLDCEAHTDVWRELFKTWNHTNEK